MKKNKNNNSGFTLIELLAVIIILGVLMIIAIPSVTSYISESRKSAYVDTAKQVVSGVKNLVNSGKVEAYDPLSMYYIPFSCVKIENGDKPSSPYGEFDKAYTVVTYDGNGYNYYWTSVDETGQGIENPTKFDDLDTDLIKTGLSQLNVKIESVEGKSFAVVFNADCTSSEKIEVNASGSGSTDPWAGDTGSTGPGSTGPGSTGPGSTGPGSTGPGSTGPGSTGPGSTGPGTTGSGSGSSGSATTTDNMTWIYKDLKLKIDVQPSKCNLSGDVYKCWNAEIYVNYIGDKSTIKNFEATFDVPEGTQLIHQTWDPQKVTLELSGTKLKLRGNIDNVEWLFLNKDQPDYSSAIGFQIQYPKNKTFKLTNGIISYNELGANVIEGTTHGGAIKVRLERTDYYNPDEDKSKFVADYNVYVTNTSSVDISDWSFTITKPSGYTYFKSFDKLAYTQNGNDYTFSAAYFDTAGQTLSPGETVKYERPAYLRFETTNIENIPVIK